MKILAVSDIPSPNFYDYYTPGKLDGYDLILAAGDLKRGYLEFLATLSHATVVYVRGNHDEGFAKAPPTGCVCAEDRIVVAGGLRILGLGGSYRYREGENMYTEGQMRRRVLRLWWQLKKHGGFDILLTHAPAKGIDDLDSFAHQGFQCFVDLLDRYHPPYHVHGHAHRNYGADIPQQVERGGTVIINAYDYCSFEV